MIKFVIHIVVLGSENVGKKTLAKCKFFGPIRTGSNLDTLKIYGWELTTKTVEIDDVKAELIFHILSHEHFWWDKNTPVNCETQVRGKRGAIILYDITNQESLELIHQYIKIVKDNAGDIPIFLVGNKLDLTQQREITKEQIEKFKNEYDIAASMEISAKTGKNVEKLVSEIASMIVNDIKDTIGLDEMRDSFVWSIISFIRAEKAKFDSKNALKKQRKLWKKYYDDGTGTFEDFIKKLKERIIKLEEIKIALIDVKELAELLKVWKEVEILRKRV